MKRILLTALITALVIGCGGPKTTNLTQAANQKTIESIPDWFLNKPQDPSYLFATATMTSRDLQMAIQKAKVEAQRDIGEQLGTQLGALTKQFREEIGSQGDSELIESSTQVVKLVTKQTLVGARIDKKEIQNENGIYRAYVLMSLPMGAANQALMDQIKANERLYTEFRASKTFQELDEELQNAQ